MRFFDRFRRTRRRAARDPETQGDRVVIDKLRESGADLSGPLPIRHYLYFRAPAQAEAAAEAIRREHIDVEVRPSAQGTDWLALAEHRVVVNPDSIGHLRALLEGLAAQNGGEYDGWEAGVEK